jgi:hypothetical protein
VSDDHKRGVEVEPFGSLPWLNKRSADSTQKALRKEFEEGMTG